MDIAVYRSLPDLDAIAGVWDRARPASPHAARRLFCLVASVTARAEPYVIVLTETGREPILVVGRLEQAAVAVKAGYRTILRAPVRQLTIVAGGVIGARTPEDHRRVVAVVTALLQRGEADLVELSKIDTAGPLYRAAVESVPRYRRGHATVPQRHHRARLAGGFDAYLSSLSRNTRQRTRRRLRRLAEAGLEVTRVGPGDDAGTVAKTLDAITAQSYQRGIGAGFELDELHQNLVSWAVTGEGFRIWTLAVRGTPAAYVSGLAHERTFFLFDTAFDPAFAEDEPGGILMAALLHELADDPDIDEFDFAFGDAQYKQSFGNHGWDEVDLLVFAARPRPLALNAVRAGAAGAVSIVKRVLGGERIAALRRRRRSELRGDGA